MKIDFEVTKPVELFLLIATIYFAFPEGALASSTQPNLQEIQARHEIELLKMQKQQQVGMLIKQRNELLANLKSLEQTKAQVYQKLKKSESDYISSKEGYSGIKKKLDDINGRIGRTLQENDPNISKDAKKQQLSKLREAESLLMADVKRLTQIQQESYSSMQSFDSQYRSFLTQEQILRKQIEAAQGQIHRIVAQP